MTDELRSRLGELLEKLFEQHRVVVWRDPSGTLASVLREIKPTDVEMPEYRGNPLSLRARIDTEDPWLERKWLLYVPPLPVEDCEWLKDYETEFFCVKQGTLSWAFKECFQVTESPPLRKALEGRAAAGLAREFGKYFPGQARPIDEGQIYLALLRSAVNAPQAPAGELVLKYVLSEPGVTEWEELGLLPVLTSAIDKDLGLRRHLQEGSAPDRAVLCRCMLACALVVDGAADAKPLTNHLPRDEEFRPLWKEALDRGMADPKRRSGLRAIIEDSLQTSGLASALQDPQRLALGPALPQIDRRVELLLLDARPSSAAGEPGWWAEVARAAETRAGREGLEESARKRWQSLHAAAQILLRVRKREEELQAYPGGAFDPLFKDYAREEGGDWEIDAAYRSLPRRENLTSANWEEALIAPARRTYHRWVDALAKRWSDAVEKNGKYGSKAILRQTEFWGELLGDGARVAVLLVDALRADLAYDLARRLRLRGMQVECSQWLAELPTRTEVGMAALMPRAGDAFSVRVEGGRLLAYSGTVRTADANERRRHLEQTVAATGRGVTLGEIEGFLTNAEATLKECARAGRIAVGHTLDIDEGGEIAAKVDFELFDHMVESCATWAERALAAGFSEVVIGTDHGFLVRDPDAARAGIPDVPATGGAFVRGLRFAAGEGVVGEQLLRLSAASMGRTGADIYVPRGTACIAVQGGPGLFVHGGLSLQECALVFLRVESGRAAGARENQVPLRIDTPARVSSLTFKVTIVAEAVAEPSAFLPRSCVLRLQDEKGQAAWPDDVERTVNPSLSEQRQNVMVTVPRAGVYTVRLMDPQVAQPLATAQVVVQVLGGAIEF